MLKRAKNKMTGMTTSADKVEVVTGFRADGRPQVRVQAYYKDRDYICFADPEAITILISDLKYARRHLEENLFTWNS